MRTAGLVLILATVGCTPPRPAPPPAPIGSPAPSAPVTDPVTAQDVEIVDGALRMLAPELQWDRTDDRQCPDPAAPVSLYCALYHVSVKQLGAYDHRRAALEEVRAIIQERNPSYQHRLMDFNNDPATSYLDVRRVLAVAGERLRARVRAGRPAAMLRDEEALILAVLDRSFSVPDALPDAGLLPASGPIAVAIEVRGTIGAAVTPSALPVQRAPRLVLTHASALQDEADRRNASVAFVEIAAIAIEGDRATVAVGVDVALPTITPLKLCCCTSRDLYERRDGSWQYVSTQLTMCA